LPAVQATKTSALRATKQKLDQALLDIGYKEKSAAQKHMVTKKLTYQDICC
jgi:hypothetical protein